MKSPLKLVIGKEYFNKAGKRVKIIGVDTCNSKYPYIGNDGYRYMDDGRYLRLGHVYDLIEEVEY